MSPLPARSPPRREPAPACSSSSLCPGGPVPAAGACSWGTAWALRSLDGFGVRGGTELPFPSRLLGAAGRGAGRAACPLGLCGVQSVVQRGKGTSVLVPGSSLAGFTRGTRASEPDGPCVRSGGEAVPHVGRGRRRGSAQEGAADVASSARCRSGTRRSPGFSQLAQQLCRAVALLVSISWCFLVSSGSGRRGGVFAGARGEAVVAPAAVWWPRHPRALPRVPAPLPAGDTATARCMLPRASPPARLRASPKDKNAAFVPGCGAEESICKRYRLFIYRQAINSS